MEYSIKPSEENNCIEIKAHGRINRHAGTHLILEAHALGNKLGISRYFMDMTDAVNDDSVLNKFQFANIDLARSDGINRFAKIAVLVDPADHSHDFIETVCRNAGLNLTLFREREKATAFLESE